MDRIIPKNERKNKKMLSDALVKNWPEIDRSIIENLVRSVPDQSIQSIDYPLTSLFF